MEPQCSSFIRVIHALSPSFFNNMKSHSFFKLPKLPFSITSEMHRFVSLFYINGFLDYIYTFKAIFLHCVEKWPNTMVYDVRVSSSDVVRALGSSNALQNFVRIVIIPHQF